MSVINDIFNWCNENNITDFYKLVDYSLEEKTEWFNVINSNISTITEYLNSKKEDILLEG